MKNKQTEIDDCIGEYADKQDAGPAWQHRSKLRKARLRSQLAARSEGKGDEDKKAAEVQ